MTTQVDAGKSQTLTLDLDPGQYAVVDFDERGNMLTAETTIGARTAEATEPSAKGTIKLGVWKVENGDPSQAHEAGVGKLVADKTMSDAVAWASTFDGPPPFETIGGLGAISPGHHGWVDLGPKRAPGNYLVYCPLPGDDGVAHLAMGMATPFSVK